MRCTQPHSIHPAATTTGNAVKLANIELQYHRHIEHHKLKLPAAQINTFDVLVPGLPEERVTLTIDVQY